jgi:hypothetical protein
MVQNYVGDYYSKEWVQKNILMLSDEDIENMKKQIDGEDEAPDEEPEQQDNPAKGDDSE